MADIQGAQKGTFAVKVGGQDGAAIWVLANRVGAISWSYISLVFVVHFVGRAAALAPSAVTMRLPHTLQPQPTLP
jgi:hypothetical protein